MGDMCSYIICIGRLSSSNGYEVSGIGRLAVEFERLARVQGGNFGDVKSVGDSVFEMRISYGPGYRVYYVLDGKDVVVLLCGGDKSSQNWDIKRAEEMAREWRR